ncbi:MAG: EthD domain-containing protein [Sphingobium sp.]
MIKMLVSARKKPEMSDREYSDHWGINHGDLVRRYGQDMGFRRYIQTHLLPMELPSALVGTEGPDIYKNGQAELWWDSIEAMLGAGATARGQAASKLFEDDEKRFCDVANLSAFLAEESVLLDLDPPSRFGASDIKLVVELWRKDGAPTYRDWLCDHVPPVWDDADGPLLTRYIVNCPVDDDRFDFARARGWKPAPDGAIEMWFPDAKALTAALSAQAGHRWKAEVGKFADTTRLRPLIGVPHYIFDAVQPG